jgi:hypothetical protein
MKLGRILSGLNYFLGVGLGLWAIYRKEYAEAAAWFGLGTSGILYDLWNRESGG